MKRTVSILAIAVLTVTAGCLGGGGGGDQQAQGPPPIEDVPDDVQMVASYDGQVVSDPATKAVLNTLLQETVPEESDQPRTVDGLLQQFQNQTAETNISVSSISGATAFSKFPSMGSVMMGGQPDVYAGILIRSGWSKSQVTSAMDDSVTESTYKGTTIYLGEASGTTVNARPALAKYGENLWVIGTEEVVRDVIDVSNGDSQALDGQLKSVYESTRSDAYIRAAIEIPQEYRRFLSRAAQGGMAPGGQMTSSLPIQNVTHLSMSYYTEGGQDGSIGMTFGVRFDAQDLAESIKDQAEGAISAIEGRVQNETIKSQIEALNVSRDGQMLSLNYESSVSDVQTMIRQFASESAMAGSTSESSSGSASASPSVSIDYEWDSQAGRLTATHAGGDTLDGEKIQAVCGGTILETPDGQIAAGDTIVETTQCSAGDTVRIIHQSDSGAGILSTFEIPGSASLQPAVAV